jgi:hypothetical protein
MDYKKGDNKLSKDGYNVIAKSNEVYFRVSAPSSGKDDMSDRRIYNALKDAGILKEEKMHLQGFRRK